MKNDNRMTRGKSGKAKNPRALKSFTDKEARMATKTSDADKMEAAKMDAAKKMADKANDNPGLGYGRPGGAMPPGLAKKMPPATVPPATMAPPTQMAPASRMVPPGLQNKPGMMPPGQFKKMPPTQMAAPTVQPTVQAAPAVQPPMQTQVMPQTMKKGGLVRGNGCAARGHTKGKMV